MGNQKILKQKSKKSVIRLVAGRTSQMGKREKMYFKMRMTDEIASWYLPSMMLENWHHIAHRWYWKCSVRGDEIWEGFWKQKALLNWLWCEWGRTRRIVWKWEQYGDFLLKHRKESSDVLSEVQHRLQLFPESLENNPRPEMRIS